MNKLPPLPERFNYTNSSGLWCYSRYTMVRDDQGAYVRAEDYDALRNASEVLLDALRQITEWPDGGNRYGQEKIKRFAQAAIVAAMLKARGASLAMERAGDLDFDEGNSRPAAKGPGV